MYVSKCVFYLQEILHETVMQERKQGEEMLKLAESESENRKIVS